MDMHNRSTAKGVTLEQDGFILSPVTAPSTTAESGTLRFKITDASGRAVTEFQKSHDKQLHLMVVRTDGAEFRHVHPTLDAHGIWSLQWKWEAAGTYRIYADTVPASTGGGITLTRTFEVAGEFAPVVPRAISAKDNVGGFTVELAGKLSASEHSTLRVSVSRNGTPVTTLQPYLGAYGHLVALREGDLAYLHVHPDGAEPKAHEVSGPDVNFMTVAPTPGRYYLYFDFQVDGQVHSAKFVVDADFTPQAT